MCVCMYIYIYVYDVIYISNKLCLTNANKKVTSEMAFDIVT